MTDIGKHDKHIQVRVITTAGSYPEHGHESVPVSEAVSAVLARAAAKLSITDTTNWVARIKANEVDPARSYADLGLHGEAKIDYGRREGGGG